MFYPASISSYDDGAVFFFRCPECSSVSRSEFRFGALSKDLPPSLAAAALAKFDQVHRPHCSTAALECSACQRKFEVGCVGSDAGMQGEEVVSFFAVASGGRLWTEGLRSGPEIAQWPRPVPGQVEAELRPFTSTVWYHGGYWECEYPASWRHRSRGAAECFESPYGGRFQIAFAAGSQATAIADKSTMAQYRSLTAAQRFVLFERVGRPADTNAELQKRLKDRAYMDNHELVNFGELGTWLRADMPVRKQMDGWYFSGTSTHTAYVYVVEEQVNTEYLHEHAMLIMRSIRAHWPEQVQKPAGSPRQH